MTLESSGSGQPPPLSLREESLLRDQALQAVKHGVVIANHLQADDPIVYVNPAFEQLAGYSAAEAIGRNCRLLQGPETDPQAVARLRAAIREERACTELLLNYRRDGTKFWNEVSLSPVRDEAGRVTHFVGVQIDVTERRELEAQLRQSQKLEAVGVLAGGVAHDFNNLLTIITGYSWMLLDLLPPDDAMRGPVEEIKKAGERSAALTRQLLSFSRKQMLAPKVFDLNVLLSESQPMLQRILGESIALEVNLDPRLDSILSDPSQIEQLLFNLVVNARDAMPQGGRLEIVTTNVTLSEGDAASHPESSAGPHVLLSVRDTGVGMTDDVRSRIFEPFFTTKGEGQGAGLGLAVVHGIVRRSCGRIEVESAPQSGSCFKVYFPVPASERKAAPVVVAGDVTPKNVETILLVDDEDAVRALSRGALQRAGYHVLAAAHAEEALKLAAGRREPIDLLVTDVVMPGLSGRQLAEQLLAARPALKILYLSGYTDDEVVRSGVSAEQVAFLQKPFTPSSLTRAVRKTLDAKRPS